MGMWAGKGRGQQDAAKVWAKSFSWHLRLFSGISHEAERELSLCQCASLVSTGDIDAPKGFDGSQAAYHGISACQATRNPCLTYSGQEW
jgi:hypothetical protein